MEDVTVLSQLSRIREPCPDCLKSRRNPGFQTRNMNQMRLYDVSGWEECPLCLGRRVHTDTEVAGGQTEAEAAKISSRSILLFFLFATGAPEF